MLSPPLLNGTRTGRASRQVAMPAPPYPNPSLTLYLFLPGLGPHLSDPPVQDLLV